MTQSPTQNAVLTPAFARRDDIGRLVVVTWDGTGAVRMATPQAGVGSSR